jgi:hypothetical protein
MSDDGQMDFEGGEEGYYDPDEIKLAYAIPDIGPS